MSIDIEVGSEQFWNLKFKLDHRIPISTLTICHPQIIPSWNWKRVKHEKWSVHHDKNGNLTQKKIGEETTKHKVKEEKSV
jgi:hypothetical protein